jgi:hypothetical protein
MNIKSIAIGLVFAGLLPFAAQADVPGRHPAYLHVLSDLRAARWDLENRPGDAAVNRQEDLALAEIDRAIDETKRAAMADGKNLGRRPPDDARMNRGGRLRRALGLLRSARNDAAREEDNPQVRMLRNRIVDHIDAAMRFTERAIHDVEMRR